MNEQIEYFKRFSTSYMRWTHFNFDRIVADAVRKDKEAEAKRKEELEKEKFKNSTYGKLINVMSESMNNYAEKIMADNAFMRGAQWDKVKIGSSLKIRLPNDYEPNKISKHG